MKKATAKAIIIICMAAITITEMIVMKSFYSLIIWLVIAANGD